MPEKYMLETMKSAVDRDFSCKEEFYEKWNNARMQTNAAHAEMQENWEKLSEAREAMNREFNKVYEGDGRRVWEEYSEFRKATHAQIELLKQEVESEKHKMEKCFARAKSAYEYGDKGEAPDYSQRGYVHKAKMQKINEEISKKCQEIRDAKAKAEEQAPRRNNAEFEAARQAFEEAKWRHENSRAKFKHLQKERNYYRKKLENAEALYAKSRKKYLEASRGIERDPEELLGTDLPSTAGEQSDEKSNGQSSTKEEGNNEGENVGFFHRVIMTLFNYSHNDFV